MIKYIGSKRVLVPLLVELVARIQPSGAVLDLFSGTSRVGHALKRAGYRVFSNDHNSYARVLGTCYVQSDLEDHLRDATLLVRELNALKGEPGYFTNTFCERSRFFHPTNGARVDAIREAIAAKGLAPELEAVMLVSLMEAADRVDSTTGVQMAYLKQWAARAHNALELRVPELLPRAASGKGRAYGLDAAEAVQQIEADICYLDPPYNQHKYLGNYHVWESLVLWDKPEVYGIACKRVDCRERGSAFNSKREAGAALRAVLHGARSPHHVVSFNNEGYFAREEIEAMLGHRRHVVVISQDFKRYVGAQIGIHNPKGEKVGQVSHLRNTEYVYIATDDDAVAGRVAAFCAANELLHQRPGPLVGPASPPGDGAAADRGAGAEAAGELCAALRRFIGQGPAVSSREAQKALGVDAATLRPLLRQLVEQGEVVSSGRSAGMRYRAAVGLGDPRAAANRGDAHTPSATPAGADRADSGAPPPMRAAVATQQRLFPLAG